MRTIRELIELAQLGEAAEFTNSIQEALSETALNTVAQMVEDPEEDEEEFDIGEDDIEDLPIEDDVDDLDEDQLDERNELNHQRARAFRAGKKHVIAKQMHAPSAKNITYIPGNRYPSAEDKQKASDAARQKKELAGAKAKSMHADATEKAIKLGGRSREMTHIRDAGAAYREKHGYQDSSDSSKVGRRAAYTKEMGQGEFLHKHLVNQHDELRRHIDDLRNNISNTIYKHANVNDNKEKYGDTWNLHSSKENKGPGLTTKHLENLKTLHKKLQHLHHAANSLAEDVVDWDIVLEDYLAIEDEYVEILQELEEGKTYKANADDNYRSHRKQSYLRRRDRRMKSEEVEEELLSLRDDLTDEELQEIVDTISEEHFELLDDASKDILSAYLEKTLDEASYSAKAAAHGKDIGKKGKNFSKIAAGAAKKYGSKEAGDRVAGAILNKLRHRG